MGALRGQKRNTHSAIRASRAHLCTPAERPFFAPMQQDLSLWHPRRANNIGGAPNAGKSRAGVGNHSGPRGRPDRSLREMQCCSLLYRQDRFQSVDRRRESKCCRGVMNRGDERTHAGVPGRRESRNALFRNGVGSSAELKSQGLRFTTGPKARPGRCDSRNGCAILEKLVSRG
jgi:hypothetical protein